MKSSKILVLKIQPEINVLRSFERRALFSKKRVVYAVCEQNIWFTENYRKLKLKLNNSVATISNF